MKVFVSGATDYIGRAVIAELTKRGHNVIGLAEDSSTGKLIESAGGKSLMGNLFDKGEWCNAIQGVDKVLSLDRPALSDENIPENEIELRGRKHAEAVTNLIGAASDGRARNIILTYSTQCYGNRHGKWVEGDPGAVEPLGLCKPLSGYIDAIDDAANASGKEVVRVYIGTVYGKEGCFANLVEGLKSGKARMVEPGDNYMNLIHVDDLASLYAGVIEKVEKGDVFNFTDNMPATQREIIEHLSDLLDVPVPEMVDFDTFKGMFGLMAAEGTSCNTRVSSSKTFDVLGVLPKLRRYDIGFAPTLKAMGIEPRAREETMKKAKAA